VTVQECIEFFQAPLQQVLPALVLVATSHTGHCCLLFHTTVLAFSLLYLLHLLTFVLQECGGRWVEIVCESCYPVLVNCLYIAAANPPMLTSPLFKMTDAVEEQGEGQEEVEVLDEVS
jgi:hypothetical protein